jgi:2-aminobenzoate-CoA ligase
MTASRSAHVDTFTRDHLPPDDELPTLLLDRPDLEYPELLNCGEELLDRTVERFGPDRLCLLSDVERWTYGDLLARANQIAHVLVDDLGVVPGNRVLLRGPNNPWMVACWFGVMKAGAVAVTTMPLLRAGELRTLIDKAELTVALCDHRFLAELEAAGGSGLSITPFGGDGPEDLGALTSGKATNFANLLTSGDDVCLIAFTSGTTGEPKGCMHFHRDVLAIADTFSAHVVQPRPDDIFTGSPPLAFTYGLGGLVVFPLRAGAASLLLETGAPDVLADAVARHRATVVSTGPLAYRVMARLPDVDLSSLRRCVSAGETLSAATWQAFFDRTGVRIIDGIGSTELLHIFIASADDGIRPGSTGRVVPGYEAQVVDDEGKPVPDGTVGRLAVRGPTGCKYLADPRQRTYVQDGWNLTGDAYVRDDDGYFWFQARTDDMIIAAGYNIAGPEVEAALLSHPDVVEAGVVGAPDEVRGVVVKAYVVLADGVPATAETAAQLQAHVKQTIAPYKYPRSVEFLDTLPKTGTGKLQRFRLRQMAAGD